jgi:hypothetical protein
MKRSFSILTMFGIVSIIAFAAALSISRAKLSETEVKLAEIEAQSLVLRQRLGEQADQSDEEFSVCFFDDPYSSGHVLRWRIKTPVDSKYRLMYSTDNIPAWGIPEDGRALYLDNANEFVLAVEFTKNKLQIRTYRENNDGRWKNATHINGNDWIDLFSSPLNQLRYMNLEPQYFKLNLPREILKLEGKSKTRLSIWLEIAG